jgi:hypothetical protein
LAYRYEVKNSKIYTGTFSLGTTSSKEHGPAPHTDGIPIMALFYPVLGIFVAPGFDGPFYQCCGAASFS